MNSQGIEGSFFGTPDFSLEFLKYLKLNKISISFIVTTSSQVRKRKKIKIIASRRLGN